MRTRGRSLLIALCALVIFCGAQGAVNIPSKAQHFQQCRENPSLCPNNSRCEEASGTDKYCICNSGFYNKVEDTHVSYPNGSCTDIDECTKINACTKQATCINTVGSYQCNCLPGYIKQDINQSGKNVICEDVTKCTRPTDCPANSKCERSSCYCERGFNNPKGGTNIRRDENCAEIEGYFRRTSPPATVITSTILPATDPITCPAGYVMSSTGKGMECSAIKNLCETYLQEQNKTLSYCNQEDPHCHLQRSIYHILKSSCQNGTNLDIENITNSASQILSNDSWSNLNSSEVRTVINGLLGNVELSVLELFSINPTNRNFSTPEIDVATKVAQENCSFLTITVGLNRMQVSCDLLPKPEDGAVFISYRNLDSRLSGSSLLDLEDPEEERTVLINSQVVTGSITSQNKENLNPPVTFYLNNLQAPDTSKISLCVYWDPKLSGWSQRGCNIIFSNISHTLCSCDHLSTFAVIIAPCDIKVDRGLLYISRIGLGVSVLCLFLSLVTFLLCRSLRSAHTSMLIALCGCLFLGQLIILFGLPQTQFRILCSIIAGCLHYILLCAFCWMTLESVLLFLTVRNLNAMNYLTSRRSHFPTACIIGFGVPAVIVAISAAVRYDGYGTGKSCWLSLNLIWSFLGPVCVFITINTTLLVLTFWILRAKLASLNANVSSLKNTRLLAFKALVQLFILGSTWILGFFQCGPGAIVASYLFTICNSLQGAFIFLVHCLLNHQVREEYRKVFHRLHVQKPESEGVSGSTVPMTLKSVTVSDVIKSDTVIDHHSEMSKTEWCKS
ncbi:adhesion G protein-coupled receptor E1 isoform X3 [Xenopus tropicalis]|uniref:Adhesion G protein-coupled receptor E1 isoform X3 n=1 Tax=Xenopus tropicalis TaxID=8364 RepID=A0A8J0QMW4_XENTR|nr:adhesion G protein-coupled receptor E1 isoform X3 [Xenopus tropicalis]|eukprot:XP_002935467.2 PREDICTED: adhesion G protein-coupled receptor E1-like isoform X1 [Xenopus tropicalis]